MLTNLANDIITFNRNGAFEAAKKAAEAGVKPAEIIDEAQKAMLTVGKKFEEGEFFMSELILAGETFKGLLEVLDPYMKADENAEYKGKIIMATPATDIHDLGKNIVSTMLKANGFDVIDLGVDVPTETIVEKVKEEKPDILGLSCLLSTALCQLKEVAEALEAADVRKDIKLMIGGGVTNESTQNYCNADFQTLDVIEGVNYCLEVTGGK